ncbi:MAG: hypothetical protein HYY14_00860 [Candidatus Omnitrophica bacterium]|nr:hypothetical protein [Candidatus Omnitrophota bacterium]
MMKRIAVLVFAASLILAPVAAFAGSPWTEEEGYPSRAAGKFGFGLKNVLLGWTEIFTQPYDDAKAGENPITSFGKGIFNMIGQTVGGALHLATFPITAVDIPLPENGNQLL